MHAYEIPGLRFSLPAGGAVKRHHFVTVAEEAATQATASSAVIGVAMNEVTETELAAGDRIVEIADGIVMVEASAAITSGSKVAPNANGAAAVASGDHCGVAITSATGAGQLIAVKLG